MADVFRRFGAACAAAHPLSARQRKVLHAVMRCRTAALGGHVDVCTHCGHRRTSYNSCGDRHCPSCQFADQERWIRERSERVLNTHYFHLVFTLPAPLRGIAQANPKVVYDALFAAAAETLLLLGRQRLGATIGVTAVLHTWTREMLLHPHVHCVVTGGGLSLDRRHWKRTRRNFLFPVAVMRKLFRGKLLAALNRAHVDGKLMADEWPRVRRALYRKTWVVFAKRTFGGPMQVFEYLGRYTHRVAISGARLLEISDDAVRFRTRGTDTVSVRPDEFVRRFLLHVLPTGFRKIRHYGLVSPSGVARLLPIARRFLGDAPELPPPEFASIELQDEICTICRVGGFKRTTLLPEPTSILPFSPRWRDTS